MEESEIQEYIDFINQHLDLNYLDIEIIRGTINRETYQSMAPQIFLAEQTVRDRGYRLFRRLTQSFSSELNKDNFSVEIQRIYSNRQNMVYVRRQPIETNACSANVEPASLIRIKAPLKMGKTLLLKHVLEYARTQNLNTVICDFGLFEDAIYDDYALLLKIFCCQTIRKLELERDETDRLINIVSNENILSNERESRNSRVIDFFETHLLPEVSRGLVLALENFDTILKKTDISTDFLRLLRSFYNAPRQESKIIWNKLHLIIIHSTDVYGTMDINYSPLAGVGKDFELKMFNISEMQELFEQYNSSLTDAERSKIVELLDGHPNLLTLAIRRLENQDLTLEQFLEEAPTDSGIFKNHLLYLWDILNQDSDLTEAYISVVNSPTEIYLNPALSFKLYSLGLVKQRVNLVFPSCNLYREYFKAHLD